MNRIATLSLTVMLWAGTIWAQSSASQTPQAQTSTTSSSAQPSPAQQQAVQQNLKDIHFDLDSFDLRDQDRQTLQENANWLKANPGVTVSIAGNADERGAIIYNLVLSQKRAEVTRDELISLGVPGDRIEFATGWGKLYPVCEQSDESCWSPEPARSPDTGHDAANPDCGAGTEEPAYNRVCLIRLPLSGTF